MYRPNRPNVHILKLISITLGTGNHNDDTCSQKSAGIMNDRESDFINNESK